MYHKREVDMAVPSAVYVVSSILLLIAAIVFFVAALRMRLRVLEKYREIAWAREQMKRGVELLVSDSVDDVLNGLQIVRALGISVDDEILRRITDLLTHDDDRVATHAQTALLSVSRRAMRAATKP